MRICVLERTASCVPRTPPKVTLVAPEKPVPVSVSTVPPRVGPADTDSRVTVGGSTTGGATYENRATDVTGDVPPGVTTRTSTAPAAWAGTVTRTCVALTL